jgi:hypothetical protein
VSKMIYLFYGILVLVYVDYVSTRIHYPLIHGRCGSYAHRNAILKSFARPCAIRTKENVHNRANEEKGKRA